MFDVHQLNSEYHKMSDDSFIDTAVKTPEKDSNSSLIYKVRTRVSNIFPNSISKWFSPSDRNGNLRRRRNDSTGNDDANNSGSSSSNKSINNQSIITDNDRQTKFDDQPPPSKRSKSMLNVNDEPQLNRPTTTTTLFNRNFTASTPTTSTITGRRKTLGMTAHNNSSPYNFSSSSTMMSKQSPFPSNNNRSMQFSTIAQQPIVNTTTSHHIGSRSTTSSVIIPNNNEPNEYDDDFEDYEDDENKQEAILLDTTDEELEDDDDDEVEEDIDIDDHVGLGNICKTDKSIRSSQNNLYEISDRKRLHIPPISETTAAMYGRQEISLRDHHHHQRQQQRMYATNLIETATNKRTLPIKHTKATAVAAAATEDDDRNNNEDVGGIAAGDDENDSTLNGIANESGSESENSSKLMLLPNRRPQSSAGRLNTSFLQHHNSVGSADDPRRLSGLFGVGGGNKRMRTDPTGSGLNFATHLQTQKSLFSDKNLSNSSTSLNSLMQRRSFNPSLYGSTSALSDSRLLNTNSPFYNGRTMYGGAAAYSRRATSSQRMLRVPTQIRPASSLSTLCSSTNSLVSQVDGGVGVGSGVTSSTSALSNTAKRILDIINQSTTPLGDVKKMATAANTSIQSPVRVPALVQNRKRFDESDIVHQRSIRLSMPRTPYSRQDINNVSTSAARNTSAMANELQVPSMSQLLQMKKKLQNNTERVRELAVGSRSVLNKEYKLPDSITETSNNSVSTKRSAPTGNSSKSSGGGKVVNKITNVRGSSKKIADQNQLIEEVNLPNIQLPAMKAMPDLRSVITKPAVDFSSTDSKRNDKNKNFAKQNFTELKKVTTQSLPTKCDEYTFSSSIKVNPKSTTKISEAFNNYTFKEALWSVNKFSDHTATKLQSAATMANFKFSSSSSSSVPSTVSVVASVPATVNVSTTKTTLKNASCLDALKTTPKTTTAAAVTVPPTISDLFKNANAGKWECSMCMIHNDQTKDKCIACESPKPGASAAKPSAKPVAVSMPIVSTFGNQFKVANAGTWECDVCMIRNKNESIKCVACENPKKGIAPIKTTVAKEAVVKPTLQPVDTGFKNIIASQNAKWECTACMTRNEPSRRKCDCCEQARPGASAESAPSFTFSSSVSTPKFQFGIPQNLQATALTEQPKTSTVTQDSTSKPTFTFGVKPTTVASTVASTFSFGKPTTTTASATFSFGKPETGTTIATKPTTVDAKFSFGVPVAKSDVTSTITKDSTDSTAPTTSFKFGAEATIPSFGSTAFGGSSSTNKDVIKTVTETVSTSTSNINSTATLSTESKSLFNFGMSAAAKSAVVSSSTVTSTSTPSFSFGASMIKPSNHASSTVTTGNLSSIVPSTIKSIPTLAFGSPKSAVTTAPLNTTIEPSKGSFSFSQTNSNVTSLVAPASASIFGVPAATTTTAAPSPLSFTAATTNKTVATTASTFVFGSATTIPAASSAASLQFGIGSATTTTATEKPIQSAGFFSSPSQSSNIAKTTPVTPQTQQIGIFGNATTNSPATGFGSGSGTSDIVTQNQQPTTVPQFMFGSNTFTAATPIVSFGQQQQPAQTFGQQNALPSFSSFGSGTNATATPSFGVLSSNTFGTSSLNNTVANATPTFGASAFGTQSSASVAQQSVVPTANASVFGAATNSGIQMNAFGNPSTQTANLFGGSSSASASPFGTPSHTPPPNVDEPSSKKLATGFNTGAPPPYQFGSGNNTGGVLETKKPGFQFSTTAAPSFNFTASNPQQTTPATPYAFGSNITPSPGVFSFGSSASSVEASPSAPFQFAAETNNNPFAPAPLGNSHGAQQRRKIKAVRRTQR